MGRNDGNSEEAQRRKFMNAPMTRAFALRWRDEILPSMLRVVRESSTVRADNNRSLSADEVRQLRLDVAESVGRALRQFCVDVTYMHEVESMDSAEAVNSITPTVEEHYRARTRALREKFHSERPQATQDDSDQVWMPDTVPAYCQEAVASLSIALNKLSAIAEGRAPPDRRVSKGAGGRRGDKKDGGGDEDSDEEDDGDNNDADDGAEI